MKEVSLNQGDWTALRDLVMPESYFVRHMRRREHMAASLEPVVDVVNSLAPDLQELEAALQELKFYIHSPKMKILVEKVAMVASCDETALIRGETGTGKEMVARLMHRLSSRRYHKMVTVNCAAIPQDLAESYLFGHVQGSFTSALKDHEGYFERAHGGTLFLDEIAELTPACQAKILRVVQSKEFERVGSTNTIRVDVRLIAATHRTLTNDTFRDDLYYRLNTLPLEIPPLRERPEEIAKLTLALLKDINARQQHQRQISTEGLKRLEAYSWPGNVRQLDSVLRRSAVFSRHPILGPEDILIDNRNHPAAPLCSLPEPGPDFKLDQFLDQARAHLILRALEKTGGNQRAAAAQLGISKQAVSQFLADKRH